jgi:hypothetical protein
MGIFSRENDLDFHTGKLEWNETSSPLLFKNKRNKLGVESSNEASRQVNEQVYNDDFYFSMLVGKFEALNEIIDSQLQEDAAHSRFEWSITNHEINTIGGKLSNESVEKGIIELSKFVSKKIIKGEYHQFLFTDIYAVWKTFLLGNEFSKYGIIDIPNTNSHSSKFICTFRKGEINYYFNYEFFNW